MDRKEIARRLIEARGSMSQVEAASKIGIKRSALAMYEIGKRIPKDDVKMKISAAYQIPVQELFFKEAGHGNGPHEG